MGVLNVTTGGSFPSRSRQFSAQNHGHAHAVAEAIAWLSTEVLPAAIEQDHRLQAEGAKPTNGFDRPHRSPLEAAMRAAGWGDSQVGAAMDAAAVARAGDG